MLRLFASIAIVLAALAPVSAQEKTIAGKTKTQWIKALKEDPSPRGREAAIIVLSTMENRDLAIVEAVTDALLGDKAERVRLKAIDGVRAMILTSGTKDQNPLLDAFGKSVSTDMAEAVRLKTAEAIKELKKEELRRLAPILADVLRTDKSVQVKVAVATTLGKTGENAKTILKGMIEALKDPDVAVRTAVADAFGRIGFEAAEAVPALRPLLKDADPGVRLAAAFSLGRVGPDGASAIPELSLALASDTDTAVRKESARAFTFLGLDAKSAVPALAKALREDKSEEVRQQAALALGKMRGQTTGVATAMIEALQKDADKTVRIFITHALGDSLGDGLGAYVKDLAEQLVKDSEGDVRIALIQELGALGPAAKDALPALHLRVTDVQLSVRDEAKKAVKKVMAK
ncbi:MAG: hypothetical protein EXS09_16705 [Gemmataceae bacterium]|nr:hypothetical protein [Gemmataceae bacterium]